MPKSKQIRFSFLRQGINLLLHVIFIVMELTSNNVQELFISLTIRKKGKKGSLVQRVFENNKGKHQKG